MSTPERDNWLVFSENLKVARGERSQAEFARFLGINGQQTYQRYETGERVPSGVRLLEMASRLGVSAEDLFRPNCKFKFREVDAEVKAPALAAREPPSSYGSVDTSDLAKASTDDLQQTLAEMVNHSNSSKTLARRIYLGTIRAISAELERREG